MTCDYVDLRHDNTKYNELLILHSATFVNDSINFECETLASSNRKYLYDERRANKEKQRYAGSCKKESGASLHFSMKSGRADTQKQAMLVAANTSPEEFHEQ
jgi:hypothetical protein